MGALAAGIAVVLLASIAFGAAMFGRRPIPQPATAPQERPPGAVASPSYTGVPVAGASDNAVVATGTPRIDEEARVQVTIPKTVKVRAGIGLAFSVLALATLIGVVASVVVVGLGMLLS